MAVKPYLKIFATSFAVMVIALFWCVFYFAPSQTAKTEIQPYSDNPLLLKLNYYAYQRYAYLHFLRANESYPPFSWIKNRHEDIYDNFVNSDEASDLKYYADFLFYIKPYEDMKVSELESARLIKGLDILRTLAGAESKSIQWENKAFEVAATTYEFSVHLNIDKLPAFNRSEYYNFLTDIWRIYQKYSGHYDNKYPYQVNLRADFYYQLLNRIEHEIIKKGVVELGCDHPLIQTYKEMKTVYFQIGQLILDTAVNMKQISSVPESQKIFNDTSGKEINEKLSALCELIN